MLTVLTQGIELHSVEKEPRDKFRASDQRPHRADLLVAVSDQEIVEVAWFEEKRSDAPPFGCPLGLAFLGAIVNGFMLLC